MPLRQHSSVTVESFEARRVGLAFWPTILARVLVVVLVAIWLWPPPLKPNPPLPPGWTPGCPELKTEWHGEREGAFTLGDAARDVVGLADGGLLIQSGGGPLSPAGLVRIAPHRGTPVMWTPQEQSGNSLAVLVEAHRILAASTDGEVVGVYELDPATLEPTREVHLQPGLSSDGDLVFPYGAVPARRPDGSVLIPCLLRVQSLAFMLQVDLTDGAFGTLPPMTELRAWAATHGPGNIESHLTIEQGGTQVVDPATGEVTGFRKGVGSVETPLGPPWQLRAHFTAPTIATDEPARAGGLPGALALIPRALWQRIPRLRVEERLASQYRLERLEVGHRRVAGAGTERFQARSLRA
ncbi:MAG TPA: hypothetical protein VEI97_07325, partial [bacterium]|nr:hypothetical protein [bacterium]